MYSLILEQNFNAGSECSNASGEGLTLHISTMFDCCVRVFLIQLMSFASLSSWVVERFLSADFRICEDIPLKLLVTKFFTAAS
jgi:hypothetical protein